MLEFLYIFSINSFTHFYAYFFVLLLCGDLVKVKHGQEFHLDILLIQPHRGVVDEMSLQRLLGTVHHRYRL